MDGDRNKVREALKRTDQVTRERGARGVAVRAVWGRRWEERTAGHYCWGERDEG